MLVLRLLQRYPGKATQSSPKELIIRQIFKRTGKHTNARLSLAYLLKHLLLQLQFQVPDFCFLYSAVGLLVSHQCLVTKTAAATCEGQTRDWMLKAETQPAVIITYYL